MYGVFKGLLSQALRCHHISIWCALLLLRLLLLLLLLRWGGATFTIHCSDEVINYPEFQPTRWSPVL